MMMQKVRPLKDTLYDFVAVIAVMFVIFCMWFVIILISYAMFLLIKEVI